MLLYIIIYYLLYIILYPSIYKSICGCKWSHCAATSHQCRVPSSGIWVHIQVALWPGGTPCRVGRSVSLRATPLPHWFFCVFFNFVLLLLYIHITVVKKKIFTLLLLPCLLFVFSTHYCLINPSGRAVLGPAWCMCTVIEINYISTIACHCMLFKCEWM